MRNMFSFKIIVLITLVTLTILVGFIYSRCFFVPIENETGSSPDFNQGIAAEFNIKCVLPLAFLSINSWGGMSDFNWFYLVVDFIFWYAIVFLAVLFARKLMRK